MIAISHVAEITPLPLQACSIAEHCHGLRGIRQLPFWWYQGVSQIFGNYSLPFEDRSGNWWYQVKPGLCWPVDFLRPINTARARPTLSKSFLGYQHVVHDETTANSHLVINVVQDIATYGFSSVDAKRRNAIRKGLKRCTLSVARELDSDTLDGCRMAWDELTQRTGWKKVTEPERFARTWKALLQCPGVTILIGRDTESGKIAGFMIVKVIGDTAYVDTIASRSEFLGLNVNDALIFAFVCSAARLPDVHRAHYAIKSTVENLERFKTSLGFKAVPFPAQTNFRPLVGSVMRVLRPANYRRMVGHFCLQDGGQSGTSARLNP